MLRGIGAYQMPKHIVRLLALLLMFLVIAYAGIVYLTDPSFYRFGHYRADVVPELAAGEPQYRGPAYCQGCHADRHAEWSAGAHLVVKCEVCHGPAGEHPASGKLPLPDDPVKFCTACHEAMPARPADHPQIVVSEHPFPHQGGLDCTTCHNAHSPAIGSPGEVLQPTAPVVDPGPTASVGIPLSAAGCVGCHGKRGEGVGAFPAIAGMPVAEFVELMNQYKSGQTPSPMMGPVASGLDDAEIRELADYYAALSEAE